MICDCARYNCLQAYLCILGNLRPLPHSRLRIRAGQARRWGDVPLITPSTYEIDNWSGWVKNVEYSESGAGDAKTDAGGSLSHSTCPLYGTTSSARPLPTSSPTLSSTLSPPTTSSILPSCDSVNCSILFQLGSYLLGPRWRDYPSVKLISEDRWCLLVKVVNKRLLLIHQQLHLYSKVS